MHFMAQNPTLWTQLGIFECPQCNFKTSDDALWQQHRFICRSTARRAASITYDQVSEKFSCSLCNVLLPREAFQEHLEGHISQKPYECPHCFCWFSTRAESYVHFKQHHKHLFFLQKNGISLRLSQRSQSLMFQAQNIGRAFFNPLNKNIVPVPFGPTGTISTTYQPPSAHTQASYNHTFHTQDLRSQAFHTQSLLTQTSQTRASYSQSIHPQVSHSQGLHSQAIHSQASHPPAIHTLANDAQACLTQASHTQASHAQEAHSQAVSWPRSHISSVRILKPRSIARSTVLIPPMHGSGSVSRHSAQPLASQTLPAGLDKHAINPVEYESVMQPMNCTNFIGIPSRTSTDTAATPSPPLVLNYESSLPSSRPVTCGDSTRFQSGRLDEAGCSALASDTVVSSVQQHQTEDGIPQDSNHVGQKERSTERVSCTAQTDIKQETGVGENVFTSDESRAMDNLDTTNAVTSRNIDRAEEIVHKTEISECLDETRAAESGYSNIDRLNTVAARGKDKPNVAENSCSNTAGQIKDYYICFKVFMCLKCQTKWSASDGHSFIKHIWKDLHENKDVTCCSKFSIGCELLERQLSEILEHRRDLVLGDNLKQAISRYKEKVSESPSINEEIVSKPASVNQENVSQPASVNKENVSEPASVNKENVSEPASVNKEKVSEPASVNKENVSEPASVNKGKVSEPAGITEKVSEPASVNKEHVSEPASVNMENVSEPASVNMENVSEPASLNKEMVSEPAGVNEDVSESFYQCGFHNCLYASDTPVDLLSHNESSHGSEPFRPCVYCGKVDTTSSGLLDHMNSHIGSESKDNMSVSFFLNERRFFVDHRELKRVIDTVQNSVSKRGENYEDLQVKYKCNLCEQIFYNLKSLECHLKRSTLKVLSCKYCRAHFLTSASCKRHMSMKHPKEPKRYGTSEKLLCKDRIQNDYHSLLVKRKEFRAAHFSKKLKESAASSQTNKQASVCVGSSDKSDLVTPGPTKTPCNSDIPTNMCDLESEREPSSSMSRRSSIVHVLRLDKFDCDSQVGSHESHKGDDVDATDAAKGGTFNENQNGSSAKSPINSPLVEGRPDIPTELRQCDSSCGSKGQVMHHVGETSALEDLSANLPGSRNQENEINMDTSLEGFHENTETLNTHVVDKELSKRSFEKIDSDCFRSSDCVVGQQLQQCVKEPEAARIVSRFLSTESSTSHFPTSSSSEKASNKVFECNTLAEPIERISDRVHFKCSFCSKQFSSYFVGLEHTKEHTSIAQNAKVLRIRDASLLRSLSRSLAPPAFEATKKYKCQHCPSILAGVESKLKQHLHFHKFFKCGYCYKWYGFLKHIKNHIRFHHHGQVVKYKLTCPPLKKSFLLIKSHIGPTPEELSFQRKRHSSSELEENQNSHSCVPCYKKRKTVSIRETSSVDFVTPKVIRMDGRFPAVDDDDVTPFQCGTCRIRMKSIQDLIGHIKWLHNSRQHKTWLIDRRTNVKFTKDGLVKGQSTVPEQRHLCTWCTFKSRSRQKTKDHLHTRHPNVDSGKGIVTFHEEPRPIFTELIGRDNSNPLIATKTQIVMESNNFKQPFSGLITNNEDILPPSPPNSPEPVLVPLQSQKPKTYYACHLCPQSFAKEIHFRIHLAQHGGFNCTTPLLASWHMCRKCGYMAQSNSDFVQHTARHLSERRFACSHCDSDSHKKGGMISHIRKVHNNASEVYLIDRMEFSMNGEFQPMAVDLDPKVKVVDIFKN